ncbi:MAG: four helix bundle protein [Burkholderiales bacterium]
MAILKRKHRGLLVWQESVELALLVYRLTEPFPKSELYGLISQLRRAATSVPANIAEGAARTGTAELLHFLSFANGSLSELDTHLEIAFRLGYFADRQEIDQKVEQVFRLLSGLTASLRRKHD